MSPDAGGAKRVTAIADRLNIEFALIHKVGSIVLILILNMYLHDPELYHDTPGEEKGQRGGQNGSCWRCQGVRVLSSSLLRSIVSRRGVALHQGVVVKLITSGHPCVVQWWLKLEMSAKLYTFNAEVREKFALLSRVQVITIGDPQDNKTI